MQARPASVVASPAWSPGLCESCKESCDGSHSGGSHVFCWRHSLADDVAKEKGAYCMVEGEQLIAKLS